jgi:putative acetyltransferase
VIIRDEQTADQAEVHAMNAVAFDTPAEACLVDNLRFKVSPYVSLVAVDGEDVIGHIMFTPVMLEGHADLFIMGLAPMAVKPENQRRGVGSRLVEAGLQRCREMDVSAVVVLGHPEYYPRFGFVPSVRFGIVSQYGVPDGVFMAMELNAGILEGKSGTVAYHEEFNKV